MTAEVRVPNRRGEGARLRDEILAAAEALLEETPNEAAVTLRAVARRAGVSAPSIYAHFADRQAILLAVVQGAFAELADRLRAAATGDQVDDERDDPGALVLATCDAYLDHAAARPQRYRLMFDGAWDGREAVATSSSVTTDDLAGLGEEALGILADRLRACVDAGVSSSTDPRSDAVALWLGLHGLAHQRAVAPAFPWPSDVVERVVRPLAGLAPSTLSRR